MKNRVRLNKSMFPGKISTAATKCLKNVEDCTNYVKLNI